MALRGDVRAGPFHLKIRVETTHAVSVIYLRCVLILAGRGYGLKLTIAFRNQTFFNVVP